VSVCVAAVGGVVAMLIVIYEGYSLLCPLRLRRPTCWLAVGCVSKCALACPFELSSCCTFMVMPMVCLYELLEQTTKFGSSYVAMTIIIHVVVLAGEH
jgi:hypothetical protein